MKQIYTFFFVILGLTAISQNTVGLLSYEPWNSLDGYNLIYPHNQSNVYLLNNCGEIVHMWEDEFGFKPGNTAYLTEDGNLLKTKRPSDISSDAIWAGGGGAIVELRDWDNNLIWDFELNNDLERIHHDIAMKPNGNVLMITWEYISYDEAEATGRDTALMSQNALWPDKIIEYNPSLDSIVWEWRSWDHLIQDLDPNKPNFGVISENPGKINLNWDTTSGSADWLHANALDFNPDNGHIVMSVPTFHEFWIIDNSTTTEEAAGSTGGFAGKGGDLLYRWGNPMTYDQGDSTDQKLFYQHDVHYIGDFLDPWHPDAGKIGLFNNRIGPDYSAGTVMVPAYDMYTNIYEKENGRFLPEDVERNVFHPDRTSIYSTGLSSFQILNNDNFLISAGRTGYTAEITPDNEVVWEYKTPIVGGNIASQGDTLTINQNLTFRFKRLPPDFPAFQGKDLEPKGYLELNANEDFCAQILPVSDLLDMDLKIYPNPTVGNIVVEWTSLKPQNFKVFDIYGIERISIMGMGGKKYIDLSSLNSGIYFLKAGEAKAVKITVSR